jgi:two-component system sensor histidine kinase/response regulator
MQTVETCPAGPTSPAPVAYDPVVLFVDDDSNLLHAMRRTLREQPYHIYTAHDASEALHIVKSRSVDLVVCDENMPGINGTDLLTWIAREFPDVVRILQTGCANLPVALRAVNECRVYRFLTKPYAPLELAMAIRTGLEHRRLELQNRKLFELTRKQVQDLERSHRELDLFSSALVHDLCQPLQGVLMRFDLLKTDERVELHPIIREHLDSALVCVRRMVELVMGLREYVGLDETEAVPQDVDLNVVIRSVLEDLAFLITDSCTIVRCDTLPVVCGFPTRLRQLFQNLMENAIKFRSEHPAEIHIYAASDESGESVFVSDNGIGIPQDQLTRVFEVFHRAHDDAQRPGSGLGLATCRKIMERHSGTISVGSAVGQGSTFRLTFRRG